MNVAVVGSREFHNYNQLKEALDSSGIVFKSIVSGGAIGADTLAERYARENNLPLIVKLPDWKTFGKSAGAKRNLEIVKLADVLFAFRVNNSLGTTITINMAKHKKIPVHVYGI
jgi:hypothetical protein